MPEDNDYQKRDWERSIYEREDALDAEEDPEYRCRDILDEETLW